MALFYWHYSNGIILLTLFYWHYSSDIILLTIFCSHYSTAIFLLTFFYWHYFTDIIPLTLFYWHYSTDNILLTLFYWHYYTEIIFLTLSYWPYSTDIILLTLFYWHYSSDIIQYWHYSTDIIRLTLFNTDIILWKLFYWHSTHFRGSEGGGDKDTRIDVKLIKGTVSWDFPFQFFAQKTLNFQQCSRFGVVHLEMMRAELKMKWMRKCMVLELLFVEKSALFCRWIQGHLFIDVRFTTLKREVPLRLWYIPTDILISCS